MQTVTEEGKKRKTASQNLVREDYHKQVKITYAEAALIAGVAVNSVQKWVYAGRLRCAGRVGPFRIDRMDLEKFLRDGISQGGR